MAQIIINASSAHVRLILRAYFNIVLPVLGLIGDALCKKKAELTLLRGKPLKVTHATGWLSGTNVAYMMYLLRRSPVGWLGIAMLSCSAFWLVSDLVVSGITYMALERDGDAKVGPLTPGNVGALWDLVTQATSTSQANGGKKGIFHKANTDSMFRADEQDIVGAWSCSVDGEDQIYPAHESPQGVAGDLASKGVIYGNWSACETAYIGNNWFLQFAVWSSSVGDWDQVLSNLTTDEIINSTLLYPWDVRATLDMALNVTESKIMRPFHCTLDTKALDFVLGKVQAATTLSIFCHNMRGNVYRYFRDGVPMASDPGAAIASTLDIITMMAAAAQSGYTVPPPAIDDPFQGCLAPRTKIPEEVITVFTLVTSSVIAAALYWLFLIIQVRKFKLHDEKYAEFLAKGVPNGLFDWMRQTVRIGGINAGGVDVRDTKHDELGSWELSPSYDGQSLQLLKRRGPNTMIGARGPAFDESYTPDHPLQSHFSYRQRRGEKNFYVRIGEIQ